MRNRMRCIFFFALVYVLQPKQSYSQEKHCDSLQKSSIVMEELGYYWKLDSLANNGFRFYTYDRLLNSKVDKVTKDFLFSKLGKPNRVWTELHGVVYVYHFFDKTKLPKSYDAPLSCRYLAFVFTDKSEYLLLIKEGDIDM